MEKGGAGLREWNDLGRGGLGTGFKDAAREVEGEQTAQKEEGFCL